jgi:hypothetical protein
MQDICFQQLSAVLIPLLALFAAIASAYAAYQANKISTSVRDFQEKLFLNEDEIKISQEILEKLTFYNVWCNDKSQIGSLDINYSNTSSEKYGSRDDAFSAIPNEVKVLCIKLQTRGARWRNKVAQWEKNFLLTIGDTYAFNEEKLEEKILEFKEFRAGLLQN